MAAARTREHGTPSARLSVASLMARYIHHEGRNLLVADNSQSLIEIWETCTLHLKHPPHPERERHSH